MVKVCPMRMFSSDKKVSAFYGGNNGRNNVTSDSGVDPSNSGSKSSYYVWFLGSRESRGLRGAEFIRPAVRHLLDKSRNSDVVKKLTLQVSSKGMKIVQTPASSSSSSSDKYRKLRQQIPSSSPMMDMKQFVPHSSITSVYQSDPPHDDVISCILLVNNNSSSSIGGSSPDCPLYVYSYRCDSSETASLLRQQLQALVERPENQAKFDDIEQKLIEKGLLLPTKLDSGSGNKKVSKFPMGNGGGGSNASSKIGSDGRSLGRSSDSGGSELGGSAGGGNSSPGGAADNNKLVTLYDSLAAELREKLACRGKHPPLLLPPRDYDTVTRSKGNLSEIDSRRALNPLIVGKNNAAKKSDDSDDGIGSSEDNNNNNTGSGGGSSGNNRRDSPANLLAATVANQGNNSSNAERYSSGRNYSTALLPVVLHIRTN